MGTATNGAALCIGAWAQGSPGRDRFQIGDRTRLDLGLPDVPGIDERLLKQFIPLLLVDRIRDDQAGQELTVDQTANFLQVIGWHDLRPHSVTGGGESGVFV